MTRTEKKLVLIWHQIPRTESKWFVWWSVRRIEGLMMLVELLRLMHESHRYKLILYSHTEVIISHAFYASYFKFCFFSMQTVPIKLFILLSIIWLLLVPFAPEHFPTVQIFMHSYPYICPWRWCQGNHNRRRCSQVSLFASKLSWELCAWKWQILSECTLLTWKKSQCIK